MIQSAHAHLRRLGSEKSQLEEEARRTHDSLRQKFLHLTSQRKWLSFTITNLFWDLNRVIFSHLKQCAIIS
jgi:hypothetical protein